MPVSLSGDPLNAGAGYRLPKKGALASTALIPRCKLCTFGIMPGQTRIWLRKPMGLSHERCASNRTDIKRVEPQ